VSFDARSESRCLRPRAGTTHRLARTFAALALVGGAGCGGKSAEAGGPAVLSNLTLQFKGATLWGSVDAADPAGLSGGSSLSLVLFTGEGSVTPTFSGSAPVTDASNDTAVAIPFLLEVPVETLLPGMWSVAVTLFEGQVGASPASNTLTESLVVSALALSPPPDGG
jgi:hypothetical protein